MSSRWPDRATTRRVLALADHAPSMHGDRPWQWRVGDVGADGSWLQLHVRPGTRAPAADFVVRDLLVGCGMALNHAVVALAAAGWQSKIRRFPGPADASQVAAVTVRRRAPARLDLTLAEAIPHRRADRRPNGSWPVPQGSIALMGARAARAGVTLRYGSSRDGDDATVLALGTDSDDPLAWLRAGEAASLVLLTATALGLASCPIAWSSGAEQIREALRSSIFGDDGYVHALVRVGWIPGDADRLPSPHVADSDGLPTVDRVGARHEVPAVPSRPSLDTKTAAWVRRSIPSLASSRDT